MYPIKKAKWLVVILLLSGLIAPAMGQDATAIVKKAYKKMQGESSKARMTMKIIRPSWSRTISMKTWSKGMDYALILITAPAGEEDTAFLKRGNEIWNWLPDIGRTIKLPPSMMSQSWMGSDFSNNDLVREASIVTDYKHTIMGDTTIRGYESYKIKMIPKPKAPVVWGKVITYITKEGYLQLRTEYYAPDGTLMSILKASEIKEMGGRIIPTRLVKIPLDEEGHKTVLIYESIKFNIGIPKRFSTFKI